MKFVFLSYLFFNFLLIISCSYSQFSLPNHLSVLLKQSPITHRNGIGILVEAGSSHEPRNVQGLAHLLEHMLFMASNKYPKEGYFKELLGNSHGYSNAMTNDIFTVYFFDIDSHSANFELIADVFSRFFIDPILQEETLSREINAVNNEYENDLNSNEWRFQELMRTLANPKSPFNHFCIGNRDTLKINSEKGRLKDIIKEFYDKFYVSSKMHLFINSNLPMNKMKKMASNIFGKIPYKPPFKLPNHLKEKKLAYPNSILGSLAWYKPIGNLKMISVLFPFENLQLLKLGRENHYFYFIEKIIKDKSENSIYTQLKKEELIVSLDIGRFDRYYQLRVMSVRFLLTAKGVGNVEKILQIFFDGLKKLKKQAIKKSYFKKIGIRNFVSFLFKDKMPFHEETIQTLFELRDGQKFEKNEILRREIFVNFDEKVISRIFDRLIPEKSIIVFASEDYSEKSGRFKAFHRIKYWSAGETAIINDFKFEQQFIDSSLKRFKVESEVENDRRILRFYVKGVTKSSIMSEKSLDKFENIMKINYAFEKMSPSFLERIKKGTNLNFAFNPNNNYFPSNFNLASLCQKIQVDSNIKKNNTFLIELEPISIYEGLIKNRSESIDYIGSFGIKKKCLNKERYFSIASLPKTVIISPTLKIWIQPNLLIISPKAFLKLNIKSNLIHVNPKIAYLERMMFISVFEEKWSENLSLIHEGGFQISIINTNDGVVLTITGFSDKIEKAGVDMLDFFKKTRCSKKMFDLILASMKRQFADYDKTPKHKLLWQYFDKILDYDNYILYDEMTNLIDKLNFVHYKKFENSLVNDFSVEVFLYGNVQTSKSKEVLIKFKKIVESHKIKKISKSKSVEKTTRKITKLPFLKRKFQELVLYQKSTNINDRNNAILNIYLCKLKKNYREALTFIHPIINIAAFNFLRTKKQLGYIVQSKYINTVDTIGISILVQGSKKKAEEMDQDIEEFIKHFSRNIENNIKHLPAEEKNQTNVKYNASKKANVIRPFFSSDIKINGENAWRRLHQKIVQNNDKLLKKIDEKEKPKKSKPLEKPLKIKESGLTKKNVKDLIEDLFGKNRKKISIQYGSIFSKSYAVWQSKTKRIKKHKKKAFISSIRQLGKYLQEKNDLEKRI